MTPPSALARHGAKIRWTSVALIVVGLFLLVRALPVARWLDAASEWVQGFGAWSPLVYGLLYTVAAVVFVPAWALTVGAGAIFGLWKGTLVVSLAATAAAGLAFLIARYLARHRVEELARRYPRFGAIDRAVGEQGWKIVALLRLSPLIPYGLSNYLYGLTRVRFWPYFAASWVAMLPGSFLYVYLGHAGRVGLEAAGGESRARSVWEWVLLGVGLAATAAVTVYVTKLARRALAEHTELEPESAPREPAEERAASPWSTVALASAAVVVLAAALWLTLHQDSPR